MSELRAKRNNKSIEHHALSEYEESIIDSSQIKAAQIIKKYFNNWKLKRTIGRFKDTAEIVASNKRVANKITSKFGNNPNISPIRIGS